MRSEGCGDRKADPVDLVSHGKDFGLYSDEKPEEWQYLDFYVLTRITLAAIWRIDCKGQRWKQEDQLVGIIAFTPN